MRPGELALVLWPLGDARRRVPRIGAEWTEVSLSQGGNGEWSDDACLSCRVRAVSYGSILTRGPIMPNARAIEVEVLSVESWNPFTDGEVPMNDNAPVETVQCRCGDITGERCEWSGPRVETVVLEHMPVHLRASHVKAGNRGVYPHNGAQHLRVSKKCAEGLVDEWTEVVS